MADETTPDEPPQGEIPAEIQAHAVAIEEKLTAAIQGYDQETGAFYG